MKNQIKQICVATAVAALLGASASVMALETVSLNGYSPEVLEEQQDFQEYQVSISNVVRKETLTDEWGFPMDLYVCQAPAAVTALDTLDGFSVMRLDEALEWDGPVYPDSYTEEMIEDIWNGDLEIEEYAEGTTIYLREPGYYQVYGNYGPIEGGVNVYVLIEGEGTTEQQPQEPAVETVTATSTTSKVLVNGTEVQFEAYNIEGNNYFKLRDVAQAITGSEKQFAVSWDAEKNAINLISGQAYTAAGGELVPGDGTNKEATVCTSAIYQDGQSVTLGAYTINGNNYFKLRDLGKAFNFGISWDAANNCIVVDTAQAYTE